MPSYPQRFMEIALIVSIESFPPSFSQKKSYTAEENKSFYAEHFHKNIEKCIGMDPIPFNIVQKSVQTRGHNIWKLF